MPDYGLRPGARKAVIRHILPKMAKLGGQMFDELVRDTPIDEGELRLSSYVSLDDQTGELEFGWDESESNRPHGWYVHNGTSEMEARPVISEVAYKKRNPQ